MKQGRYMFVDDGSPEASDYDTNFVCCDAAGDGSCKKAVSEVNRSHGIGASSNSRSGPVSRLGVENGARGAMSGTPAVGVERKDPSVWRDWFMNGCARLAMARLSFRANRRRASRTALLPSDR